MSRKLLLALIALPVLLAAAVLLYLELADLSGWSPTIARAASDRVDREVTIGRFRADPGGVTRLVFEDLGLANPSWSTSPLMARADRVEISFGLWSLISGPLRIVDLRLQGAKLLLETDGEGRGNWELEVSADEVPQVLVEALELADAEIRYRDPAREESREASVQRLRVRSTAAGWLDLEASGSLEQTPFELAGRVGPLEELLAAGSIEHELTGRWGDVDLTLGGAIADLATLAGLALEIEIDGPDVAGVARAFGLPPLGAGPFRVSGAISPVEPGGPFDLQLDAAVGEVEIEATGRVSSLRDPRDLDLTIDARGPGPESLGAINGIDRLPPGPFSVSGKARLTDSGAAFERFAARIGGHRLSADGLLSWAPEMSGSEVVIEAEGPDLSSLGGLAGIDLPPRPYRIRGRLASRQGELAAEGLEGRIGATRLWLDGTLGRPPSFAGAAIDLRIASPDPAAFSALAGFRLPSSPLKIEGHLGWGGDRLSLRPVVLKAAESEVLAEGVVFPVAGLAGTDLELRAAGPDLARAAALVPVELPELLELPAERYEVAGRVRALGARRFELEGVEGSLGEIALRASGRLDAGPGLAGSNVLFRVAGPDVSRAGGLAGLAGLPAQPFDVSGRLGASPAGYALDDLAARAGDIELKVAGLVGPLPDLDGTDLEVEARGPRLSDLGAWRELPPLPEDPFDVAGRVRIDGEIYRLEEMVGELGLHRATASGAVGPLPGMGSTELLLSVAGSDAGSAGRILSGAGLDWVPDLPPDRYAVTGELRLTESGFGLSDVTATLGGIEVRAEARLASFARATGLELTADVTGPDASVVGEMAGVRVPAQAFGASGRAEILGEETRFHQVRAWLGDHRVALDGTLGKPPRMVGTRLELQAEGPDTTVLAELLEKPEGFPDQPYEVGARLAGSPQEFLVEDLQARFGASDLAGSLRVDLREKPYVRLELRSERIDLPTLLGLPEPSAAVSPAGEIEAAAAEPAAEEGELVFADEPFELGVLDKIDAEVAYRVDEVTARAGRIDDVEVIASLRDGRLDVERSSAAGETAGAISLGLTLEPVASGYRALGRLTGSDIKSPGLTPDEDLARAVPLDFDLSIEGVGDSPHAMARSLDGHLIVAAGAGQIDLTLVELAAARLPLLGGIVGLIRSFNPLAGASNYTNLECIVAVARVEDGVVELEPVATRSEYLDVLGVGRVDLETEELAFRWATKPRGLRLGLASAADSLVKVGGTLGAPEVETKPLAAATATGLAIGTGGLSLAATGLLKRVTADKKLCKKALNEARKARAEAERAGS